MKRHLFCGVYDSADKLSVKIRKDELLTKLNLVSPDGWLNYGIGNALHDLAKLGIFPSETGIDLLILAAHIQAADINISRASESQDCWTREIKIVVPVSDAEKWIKTIVPLKRALDFLTGDIWSIEFRQQPKKLSRKIPPEIPLLTGIPYDTLSLFSGGLDSLIGAIDLLEKGKHPLLISHASDGPTSTAQEYCYKQLKEKYPTNSFDRLRVWMSFPDVKIESSEHEKTTRGRSFLFFALGVFAGTGLRKPFILGVPENGLIALNVPLDPLRLGSHSTRTTHPFYIARWNEVLNIVGINGSIQNPYWDKTKGEMVANCSNTNVLKQLTPLSISCSSPSKGRWNGLSSEHCGYCLPCIIRRAALEFGFGPNVDKTKYSIKKLSGKNFSSLKAEGETIRSLQFAINRLSKNPQNAQILIYNSGPLSDVSQDSLTALAKVYCRGMQEVEKLLSDVKATPK